jgi:hypothetical protein
MTLKLVKELWLLPGSRWKGGAGNIALDVGHILFYYEVEE